MFRQIPFFEQQTGWSTLSNLPQDHVVVSQSCFFLGLLQKDKQKENVLNTDTPTSAAENSGQRILPCFLP